MTVAINVRAAGAAALLALGAAGCSPAHDPVDGNAFNLTLDYYIELATEEGVSPAQIETLVNARAAGELAFADIDPLYHDLVECYEQSGFEQTPLELVEAFPDSGLYRYNFVVIPPSELGEDAVGALMNECQVYTLSFAEAAYFETPVALEARDRRFDTAEVRACLARLGIAVDDASAAELRELVFEDIDAKAGEDPRYEGCEPRVYG